MVRVVIYSTRFCPYCVAAKRLLTAKGISFEEIMVDADPAMRAEMQQLSGRMSVPQIFIGERHIGGFTDLVSLDRSGELAELLGQAS
jgi:glutaredoxin 3